MPGPRENPYGNHQRTYNVVVVTVDMQKGISMPKTPINDYYFSRKLVLFNETFPEPGKNGKATCYIWHEGEAGRRAFNITSTKHGVCKTESRCQVNHILL